MVRLTGHFPQGPMLSVQALPMPKLNELARGDRTVSVGHKLPGLSIDISMPVLMQLATQSRRARLTGPAPPAQMQSAHQRPMG
jgi:hypothetical protein